MGVNIENLFRRKLEEAGLLPYLSVEASQFLDFPGSFFVDLVLKDGTKLAEVRTLVEQILKEKATRLDVIVRTLWEIERVGDPEQLYSRKTGTPRAAVGYPVDLRSGKAATRVWVEVTYLAEETFESHGADREDTKRIVREYVAAQLKIGGASYWDPEGSPHLEINGDTAGFIVSGALPGWEKRPAV